MMMISKNPINEINCINYKDKMNNVLKKHNIQNILIITIELSKTKNFIVFTIAENTTINLSKIENHEKMNSNFQSYIKTIHDTKF